ncbi:hypothetical protein ACQEU8_03635 [Streptomyces sp. CA-250714]|uniref:hypothetical protein n=1 Tax=Streptomyces sp. CA-250714 TaxID=3240060 RepID=UPI003D9327CF
MHGGLPLIGLSMLVYGAVGAAALTKGALDRFRGRTRRTSRNAEQGRGTACASL